MQALDGLGEALERGGDLFALVQEAQQVPDLGDLARVGLRHHLGDDLRPDVPGLDVADVADASAVQSDLGRVVGHQAREEAVQRPQGEALHGEQGLPQEVSEKRRIASRRQVQTVHAAQIGGLRLARSGLGQLLEGPRHELSRRRPGKRQGDDLLGLGAGRQQFDDAIGEREGLARAGRGQDDLIFDGELAHWRMPPSWSMLRYSFMRRPFSAARIGYSLPSSEG